MSDRNKTDAIIGWREQVDFSERYWLFYGQRHYPNGGMADFQGSFSTAAAAAQAFDMMQKFEGSNAGGEWYHVFDSVTGKTELFNFHPDWGSCCSPHERDGV